MTRLAADLQREFPEQRGWSPSNLKNMRRVAEVWPTLEEFGQRPVGRLPWGHVITLLERLSTRDERDWYAAEAAENGWTRPVLEYQIKFRRRDALGAAPTNFTAALDAADSELAQAMVKDPYVFEHLGLVEKRAERDVELKVGKFEPAHLGQLGTYVAIVDDQYRRHEIHAPTVGILLCTGRSGAVVRYSLASTNAPVAVADLQGLPDEARGALPSVAELQAVVADELERRS